MRGHVHYIFSMLLPTVAQWIPARQKSAQHIHNIRRMKGEQIDGQGVTPAPVPAPLQGISQDKEVLLEDD